MKNRRKYSCRYVLMWCFAMLSLTAHSQIADSLARQQAYLKQILDWLPDDRPGFGPVSYFDSTFKNWLERTGELPPDFSEMPSIPDLPDPLIIDEGGVNVPVKTRTDWFIQQSKMRSLIKHYITGTFPPAPGHISAEVLKPEKKSGLVTLRSVELSFGPGSEAKLNLELMIPPGEGPFPVFMTQWNHREWAQIAVRRGYIACIYAGADSRDDTEDYSRIWGEEYDFTRLMRRAWGCSRAIDYLYTLPIVDKEKIALTGHSRNGKQSLMAAAFDERIKAVVPSSGGTGAEVPWRYCAYPYDVEDIALLGPAQPSWLHPRLRFFAGREDKLPVDQNSLMALIAPRGLMLSTAVEEGASNPWGIEKAYYSAKSVYEFLEQEDRLFLRYRRGRHGTNAEDIESYIDFFDFIFDRTDRKPETKLGYVPSLAAWQKQSAETVNTGDFRSVPDSLPLLTPDSLPSQMIAQWWKKKTETLEKTHWLLGNKPYGIFNEGPGKLHRGGQDETYFGNIIPRPPASEVMERMAVSPYRGFGDYLYGYLYYPRKEEDRKEKMPVVIYLHEYDYSKGFSSMSFEHNIGAYFEALVKRGFAVFAYDMVGFGSRQQEGLHFYDRYPHWSKMGKMVTDVSGAVTALSKIDDLDSNKIFVSGYSLGGTVGLFAAALDYRIAGLISVAGFTPLRHGDKSEHHFEQLAEQHLLIPRLGFFEGDRRKIPVDYKELMAAVAPRPTLIIAPKYDNESDIKAVKTDMERVAEAYSLLRREDDFELFIPEDYNRFSEEMREKIYEWLEKQID